MQTCFFRSIGAVLFMGCLPVGKVGAQVAPSAPAATTPAGLAGTWKGPLPIPGGSLPIQVIIAAPGADKLTAMLDLPARRLNRLPMTASIRRDTVYLFAAGPDSRYTCVLAEDGQELRGTWTQPGLRVPLVLHKVVAVQAAAINPSVAVVTYHTEPVTITSQPDNVRLVGTLSIPDGKGPFPAAVLLSDIGPHDRDEKQGKYRLFADIASTLAGQGIAVLRLDDRGVGESAGVASLATTAVLVHDAQAALAFLRVRPSIDAVRTGLIGHGEGGNVALLAATQAVPPAFVVAMAASGVVGLELLANQPEPMSAADTARTGAARRQAMANVLAEAARLRTKGSNAAQIETYLSQQRLKMKGEERRQAEATLKYRRAMLEIVRQTSNDDQAQAIVVNMLRQHTPGLDPGAARNQAAQFTTPQYRYYLKFDPQVGLAGVKCPVLLLQGTDDTEVNAAANLSALEKGLKANKRVAVRRLPGVNHLFQAPVGNFVLSGNGSADATVSPLFLEALRDWLVQEAGK